jgi:hypothetical protein
VSARLDGFSKIGQLSPSEGHTSHRTHGAFGVALGTAVEGKGAQVFLDHGSFQLQDSASIAEPKEKGPESLDPSP